MIVVSEEVLEVTKTLGSGRRGRLYLMLHCHHHNDSRIHMGSNESHFNVSLTVRDKVTSQHPQLLKREESQSGIKHKFSWLPAYSLTASPNWLTWCLHLVGTVYSCWAGIAVVHVMHIQHHFEWHIWFLDCDVKGIYQNQRAIFWWIHQLWI